ncbi:hypothetical protein T459_19430 [Capsicum annuum]|uniref:Aminotransferase-like plant mobile domain-containing protein n=1 Tax=Capsicum annuum TaxID=4072 RepID=A0A2G2Z1P3_CAPAN|nr:hypothetical protein T459_19430 [Capsicum annuum]
MTCFNDRETPYPYFEIVESKPDSHAKPLTLKVHPPVIGAFPLVRNPLETYLHLTERSTTETKDVMDNFSSKIMTENVLLLKSSTHQNIVVASSPSHNWSLSSWRVPPSKFGVRSSFFTLRNDDDLIVEPYSPHQFRRQFGFCQDVLIILTKHHFDGSLLALVQLWDSYVRLGSLSNLNIPMRPLDNGTFMTREYLNWWPAHRETVLR